MRAAAPGDVSPLRAEAESIAREAIAAMRPRAAVLRALAGWRPHGRVLVAAVGKAAWAMAAAPLLAGLGGVGLLAVGSDGTDGPTDAAGGYVDGDTQAKLHAAGLSAAEALMQNDSYHALAAGGGLVFTGPTGTNVNDLLLALCEG